MTTLKKYAISAAVALTTAFSTSASADGVSVDGPSYVKNGEPVMEFTRPADTKIPDGCEKLEGFVSKGEPVARIVCPSGITP